MTYGSRAYKATAISLGVLVWLIGLLFVGLIGFALGGAIIGHGIAARG